MSTAPPPDPRDRLRYLTAVAGLRLTDEELERLALSQEYLAAGLRRLHEIDLGDQEPVLVYRPRGG